MDGTGVPDDPTGVLLLPPDGDTGWRVVEVDADLFAAGLSAPEGSAARSFDTSAGALSAAFDVLTLLAEGRMPAMHEHVQESVRDFVKALEARGYDRQAAVRILLDMVDRRASAPPKPIDKGRPLKH